MDKYLTIAQAAEALGVCKDTIRRRVRIGEIRAEKRPTPYGDAWYINAIELTGAVRNVDVVKVEHTLSREEIIDIFTQCVQGVVEPLHNEVLSLRSRLESMEKAGDARDTLHYERLDLLLMEITKRDKKGLWGRLLGK